MGQTQSNSPSRVENETQPEVNPAVQDYNSLQDLPISYTKRTCTDIFCIIIGISFSAIMLILSVALFNQETFVKSNFPTDSDGNLCGVDVPAYPLVYFADAPKIDRRVCVSSCPSQSDTKLNCYTTENVGCRFSDNEKFLVSFYDNAEDITPLGSFCMPTDQTLKNQIIQKSRLEDKQVFFHSIGVIGLCCLLSLGLSVLYMILVQCFPKFMNTFSVFAGMVISFVLLVCFLTYSNSTAKAPLIILFLIVFVILLVNYIKSRKAFEIQGVFLEAATKMLKDSKTVVFFYIPLFLAFTFLFGLMLILEFKSLVGGGKLDFNAEESLFWEFEDNNSFLVFLLFLQMIWGVSFLKEAFNYCVSGNAVDWYYSPGWECYEPMQTLITKHFGSVIGGSFITGYFSIVDYLFDLIKPPSRNDEDSTYSSCFNFACGSCLKLLDLVRSDSMAYINLTGVPFCNSARYCEYLCDKSLILDESQSTSRTYRLCAHFLIAGLVGILSMYIAGEITGTLVALILVLSLFISTYFISIHADAAEAIIILFLNNQELESRKLAKTQRINRADINNFNQFEFKQGALVEQVRKARENALREKEQI